MSTSWKAGNRALCIDDAWEHVGETGRVRPATYPTRNTIYLVSDVDLLKNNKLGLVLAGLGDYVWSIDAFRKIVPICDREAETYWRTIEAAFDRQQTLTCPTPTAS